MFYTCKGLSKTGGRGLLSSLPEISGTMIRASRDPEPRTIFAEGERITDQVITCTINYHEPIYSSNYTSNTILAQTHLKSQNQATKIEVNADLSIEPTAQSRSRIL